LGTLGRIGGKALKSNETKLNRPAAEKETIMAKMHPYLSFDGNCREAMTFYKDCLGGELELNTVGDSPMAAQMPAEAHDRIMHSMLTNGNFVLMASDMLMPGPLVQGNTVTLCMVGENKGEVEAAFAKLAEGGQVTHAIKEEFFGTYGDLTDKFGQKWAFQFGMGATK
jgi:PhnB protein